MIRIVTAAFMVQATGPALAAEDPPAWSDVSAIFVERCVMCHSMLGAALGLRLDTYEAAMAGSTRGPVLVAGDPVGSELLRRLRAESLPRMPFLSYPLPPEQIALIERWVAAGLPDASGDSRFPGPAD